MFCLVTYILTQLITYELFYVALVMINYQNKKTVAKNYGINVQCNLCVIKIIAKSFILEHLYKSGVGSYKSQGFGLLDII